MGRDDSQGRPGGFRGSPLIIALIIVAFGFLMYLSHTEKNPVTGVKQHVSITPEQEIKLGIQSAPEMAAQMGEKFQQMTQARKKCRRSEMK